MGNNFVKSKDKQEPPTAKKESQGDQAEAEHNDVVEDSERNLTAVCIQPLNGASFIVDIDLEAKVLSIMAAIEKQIGVPAELQQLFVETADGAEPQQLKSTQALSACGITENSTLTLLQMSGPRKYTLPGSKIGGAHTNNDRYFKYHNEKALELKSVCWLDVGCSFTGIHPGDYEVFIFFSSKSCNFKFDEVEVKQADKTALKVDWKPSKTGGPKKVGLKHEQEETEDLASCWQEHRLGKILVEADKAKVSIKFRNLSGSWKSGLIWRAIELRRVY